MALISYQNKFLHERVVYKLVSILAIIEYRINFEKQKGLFHVYG
jgi:hypothetical protein